MNGAISKLALIGCAAVLASPVQASDATHFTAAYKAFLRSCLEPAPSFKGTPRAAKAFGVKQFRFDPQLENSSTVGM